MAEAKTKTKSKKAKSRAKAKPPKRAASSAKSNGAKRKAPKRSASKAAASKPQAVLNTVEETAKDAGGAVGNAASKVGHAASKAKVPLMAGGAALAGAAGGLALARGTHHRNGLAGIGSKELTRAARKAGGAGLRVGELALEGRRAEARNGNGRKPHRSPIEVVLEGLTSRS